MGALICVLAKCCPLATATATAIKATTIAFGRAATAAATWLDTAHSRSSQETEKLFSQHNNRGLH